MARYRTPVVVAGVAASAAFVYLAVRHLDLGSLEDAWKGSTLFPWLPIGIAAYLLGHIVRGHRCRLLVRHEAALPLVTASNIVVVGYASNNVLPARLGEFVRAGMLAERTGIPVVQSLTVTFIERVLDGIAILMLLFFGTLTGDAPGWIHDVVRVALLVFGVASGVMLTGAHLPGVIVTAASRLGNKLGSRWHDRLVSLASSITNAGLCLRDPRDAAVLLFYSLLVWILEAGLFIAIFPAFGLPISVQDGVVAMSVTNLGLLVPSSPGFIGPFHYFCSRALMAHGVPEVTALAYATLVHLAFYVPVTIWGATAMMWYGVEVGSTAAMVRQARRGTKKTVARGLELVEISPLSPGPPPEPTSAFTIGLVEAMVVADGMTPRPEAVAYAADFVEGQLRALPAKLRLLFNCGMTFFRFVTRLRFFRGYCDVPLDARRRWTLRWAESRVALFRQLFKPVRATGLLAYYDHDSVKTALLSSVVPVASLVRVADGAERVAEPS